MKVSDHLTYLAEAIIDAVVTFAWPRSVALGSPDLVDKLKRFLVIGYGKLGRN